MDKAPTYILCIDTALEHCGVGLIRDGAMLEAADSDTYMRASEILHQMIHDLLERHDTGMRQLAAIAVNGGPGSYTGLRIGASAAKGLCYALGIPLIHLGGLELMVEGAIRRMAWDGFETYIPMIDARRSEVFTATFNADGRPVSQPGPLVLDEDSYSGLAEQKCLFFGNAAEKASGILSVSVNWEFRDFRIRTSDFEHMAWQKWLNEDFEDAVHYTPSYLKKFHFIATSR